MQNTYENYLNEGNILLNRAEEELNKPLEDVMTLSVCYGTKLALDHYFKAFLTQQQVTKVEDGDIMHRYQKCISIRPEFAKIDLKSFDCIHDEKCEMSDYCLSIDKVSDCIKVAEKFRDLI